uniref:LigA n=1 Tax=Parastrongyloides trichosuri TaxID=131310 RepID=A0A0N4Z8J0_PARTI
MRPAPLRVVFANQGDAVETVVLEGVHDLHEVAVPGLLLTRDGVDQFSVEAVRTRAVVRDARVEVVVEDNGRDSGEQADTGSQQGFSNTRSNDGQVGRVGLGDADEGVHDAPHGTEQTDERTGRTDGGQELQAAREALGQTRLNSSHSGLGAQQRRVAVIAGHLQASLTRQFDFLGGGSGHVGQRVAVKFFRGRNATHVSDRASAAEGFQEAVGGFVQRAELQQLDDQQGPGEHRSQQQADHDDLNHCGGFQEHGDRGDAAAVAAADGVSNSGRVNSGSGVGGGSSSVGGRSGSRSSGCRSSGRGCGVLRQNRRARHQDGSAGQCEEDIRLLAIEHCSPVPALV